MLDTLFECIWGFYGCFGFTADSCASLSNTSNSFSTAISSLKVIRCFLDPFQIAVPFRSFLIKTLAPQVTRRNFAKSSSKNELAGAYLAVIEFETQLSWKWLSDFQRPIFSFLPSGLISGDVARNFSENLSLSTFGLDNPLLLRFIRADRDRESLFFAPLAQILQLSEGILSGDTFCEFSTSGTSVKDEMRFGPSLQAHTIYCRLAIIIQPRNRLIWFTSPNELFNSTSFASESSF